MKSSQIFISFFFLIGLSQPSNANNCKNIFHQHEIRSSIVGKKGYRVFYEILHGSPNKETILFVNGMTYDLQNFRPLMKQLNDLGHTVIVYEHTGQGLTQMDAVKNGRGDETLTLLDLADELDFLAQNLVPQQQFVLAALSYGSTIATEYARKYPEKLEHLILLAPHVKSLEHYDINGQATLAWLNSIRNNLFLPHAIREQIYEQQYEQIYRSYFNLTLTSTPPNMTPIAYKSGVFQRVRAARDFQLKQYLEDINDIPVSAILAGEEEPRMKRDQIQAWQSLTSTSRHILYTIQNAMHGLPGVAPKEVAMLISRVLMMQDTPGTKWTLEKSFELKEDNN